MGETIRHRMSPLTAFFLGLFTLGISLVASVTALALYGLKVVDSRTMDVMQLVTHTVDRLPELVEEGSDVLSQLLHDERATGYAKEVEVKAHLLAEMPSGQVVPSLTIHNTGDRVVTLLGVRVAALDDDGVPRAEWTEVVATPLTIDGDWRGPLQPGATRHVLLRSWHRFGVLGSDENFTPAVEVTDVRVLVDEAAAVARADEVP